MHWETPPTLASNPFAAAHWLSQQPRHCSGALVEDRFYSQAESLAWFSRWLAAKYGKEPSLMERPSESVSINVLRMMGEMYQRGVGSQFDDERKRVLVLDFYAEESASFIPNSGVWRPKFLLPHAARQYLLSSYQQLEQVVSWTSMFRSWPHLDPVARESILAGGFVPHFPT